MKSPIWISRTVNDAKCDRCGGKSHFVFMKNWRSVWYNANPHFTFWRWWKGFKRHHSKCINREKSN